MDTELPSKPVALIAVVIICPEKSHARWYTTADESNRKGAKGAKISPSFSTFFASLQ